MSENSDKTTFKVRLSGEDYHDIVIDWKDTSCPYKQQVFRQLAEITGIPIEFTLGFSWTVNAQLHELYNNLECKFLIRNFHSRIEFNKGKVIQLMNVGEHLGLSPRMYCYDQSFYIHYNFTPEMYIHETACTFNFCHYTNNRAFLNKLKSIITNEALHEQIKKLLVQPRYPEFLTFPFQDEWFSIFRHFNIMQYYGKSCHIRHQYDRFAFGMVDYVAPQQYKRTSG